MAHLQYMPGDPRLVDQLVYELKSKGIFDQFRKECIADVDTRPAYQNLRQRVENSVSTFLSRQCWKPDLNKNQLREKLRKHILDGNYLEQGVERIVDQVVNPKVASVFIPQVEDLVYNYLGISRKKSIATAETSNGKVSTEDLLPTDLEAVSPGSVKSNDDNDEKMDTDLPEEVNMDVEEVKDVKEDSLPSEPVEKPKEEETQIAEVIEVNLDSDVSIDKSNIPLPTEDIRLENIPAPENSPPKIELENIELPKEPNIPKEIPLPDQIPLPQDDVPKEQYFKPINLNSDDESSSDSSLRRNMSPLTPIRNYNNENSCDAQQGFDNDSDSKSDEKKVPSTFRFAIELKSTENSLEGKQEKKEDANLAYQFNSQVNINTFNTPMYEDSSNSNNLHIDYESDVNSKNIEKVPEDHNSEDSKKEKKTEEKKSSHKSSHRSRDSHRHSSSKDKRSDSKHSTSRDSSRHDKKPKDDHSSKSKSSHKERERSRDKSDKKDSRDSSKHRSHRSSGHKDSKSHRSSSSSQRHSSKQSDRKSSSNKDKERSSEKTSDKSSKERDRKDSKSSSHRSDKDRKSSSSSSKSKHEDKDKKKEKKDTDDHYSLSGRGNHSRRSTDRDSNDGSSSSKGSHNQTNSKLSEAKKESKESSSKSDNTSTSGESTSPSDKEVIINNASDKPQQKPIRVENHLEMPIASPPRLPFVPDVTLKKPKFAANLAEAKKMMRMRKFLDEEQKRMNQEAALLLEFQANVRPSLSQVYSSIPGPELEFACVTNDVNAGHVQNQVYEPENTAETIETDVSNEQNDLTINNDDNETITDEVNDENTEIGNDDESMNTEPLGNETYNENKPFSQLVNEISERNKSNDRLENLHDDENKIRTEYFEVTIITEELSESEEPETANKTENIIETHNPTQDTKIEQDPDKSEQDNNEENVKLDTETDKAPETTVVSPEEDLHYFAEHEKYDADIKRHQYSNFLKSFMDKNTDKIYLFNCDTYEENIIKEVSTNFGSYEIINYYRNGHLTLPKPAKNVVNLASEITLPVDCDNEKSSPVFSPVKSECSFELSSDYDAKLEEMVNKTSRQEVMEIILGSVTDRPTIDYCTESSIDSDVSLKRKMEAETTVNNNRPVLIPKIRKLSESDLISSTTEETEEISNNNRMANSTRSKYLGKARRVGLPRPRRANLPNSPSSDKSVENYAQNTPTPAPAPPNGKLKPPRAVQRYDTADLYKPKLHYLSRRNNIS